MPATYDPSLPTAKDWVRFLTGDRTVTAARLQDEEIDALVTEEGNKYLAAARALEIVTGGGRGGVIEKTVDDLKLRFSDSADSALARYIKMLREKGHRLKLTRPSHFKVYGTRPSSFSGWRSS